MKKILFLALTIAFIACESTPKDYVTLSGKITDKNSDSLVVRTRTYSKTIKVNQDGTFNDTLKVVSGVHNLFDGKESTNMFLQNGFDINVTIDTKQFDESVTYTGTGAETSNYLAKKMLLQEKVFTPNLIDLEEEAFKAKVEDIKNKLTEFVENNKNIDSTIYANEKIGLEKMSENLLKSYKQQKQIALQMANFVGKPSPEFVNYENHKGGTTSLTDLKGKYVYIDVWATWCGPCKAEIPSLKKIEKQYHGKNIEFVSISIDNEGQHDAWRKMVTDKELGGIQLLADKNWQSDFVTGYGIRGIPRFILIDPAGNVVNADAPRPSSPKLIELFTSLEI
ncbi:TlpA disulfide reductase family protein [Flavivirga aquimarina]|uniref:TlpA disulfide reductase family protein n=1 Tax=Flavivirga aquimarina TaxID=2027862 RepID=A0ABT8WEC5_9FLAO|nr:TlpA disulfide reductase family protein [Flavivirga aquimarina]MDO5971461.1 TlpA disulfide reductase family protein [Flavivirga aquimarina]